MRLPQHLLESPFFLFQESDDLIAAIGDQTDEHLKVEIQKLSQARLPPIVSQEVLATMLGVNAGLIWSFIHRSRRHYRRFEIPKGRGTRQIVAPRVALKIIQKWISVHLSNAYNSPDHVFGFVAGRSHIDAAKRHVGAQWAYSADIENFFGTTPANLVAQSFERLGYSNDAALLCASLTCLDGVLAQGAPSSPVISNMCFTDMDNQLVQMAAKYGCTVTRYADDIVFSGQGEFHGDIRDELRKRFSEDGIWRLSKSKELLQPLKGRIKIHGFLIGPDSIRLTKGYRNRLRAYAHVIEKKGSNAFDLASLRGHLHYAAQVEGLEKRSSGFEPRRLKELLTRSRPRNRNPKPFFSKLRKNVRNFFKIDQGP